MSRKRRNTSSAEPESPEKKRRPSLDYDIYHDASDSHEQPQINASNGLTNAFPGLGSDEGLFYGPAQNGLDYLRMVRSEAQGIPQLLTAPQPRHESLEQNTEGFFDEDEAFVAAPVAEEREESYSKAQEAYYEIIMERFNKLRAEMKIIPSLDVIQSLPSSRPISFPASSKVAKRQWEEYLMNNSPNSVQLACMDWDSVLELLKLITKKLRTFLQPRNGEYVCVQRIGAWLWAILAKCPDRGELCSDEISDLRACAKAADMAWRWLQNKEEVHDNVHNEYDDADQDTSDDDEVQTHMQEDLVVSSSYERDSLAHKLEDAGERRISGVSVRQKKHVILDMIITVIGETYGQRDLLDLRRPWGSAENY